jgi:hypothetical protein
MTSRKCEQCKHFIIAKAGEGKIYGCDRSKCVFEPITKNSPEIDMAIKIIKADDLAPYSVEDILKARDLAVEALKQMTTTKNLGVDCISREQALNEFCIYNPYDSIGVDKVKSYLKALPSVTQPRKGEWLRMSDLSEQEDDRYKCSRCGNVIHHKNEMDLYTFNSWCGRCGSDNGR